MTTAVKALRAEIAEKRRELDRYERALALLESDPPTYIAGSLTNGKTRVSPKAKPKGGTRIGTERLARYQEAIRSYAADHDEFRQIDIRSMPALDVSSSVISQAFELLRQQGFIRFARQDGNNKWYRMTRAALMEANDEARSLVSDEQLAALQNGVTTDAR